MRIKKLELHGFKSFKDRTVIHFDEGITGIVGPNGCGKSNIVDALVWVMGEMSAKHLRGGSMSDVIFAGADGYAPVGMAEVSLTLENDGGPFPAKYLRHSEIMVTRRLHRSGESEYLINKEQARLRDIQEVFMDTGAGSKGFSIVEQGAIGRIVTAKPEDRRSLIEEAAGITKFKVRKRESQRKLVSTEQNLTRLQDIIGEQKRQLDSLQRQAQRAERYRKLKTDIEDKELWINSKEFLSVHEETQAAQQAFDDAQALETSSTTDIDTMKSQLERLKLEVSENESRVTDRQVAEQEAQKRVQEKERAIRELEFEIEQARRNKEMTGSIVEQHQARKNALTADRDRLQVALEEAKEAAEKSQTEYDEKRGHFDQVQARVNQIDSELTDKRRGMLGLSSSQTHLEAKITSVSAQRDEAETRLKTAEDVLQDLLGKKQELSEHRNKVYASLESERQMHLDIMKDVDNFQENLDQLSQSYKERQAEVSELGDELKEVSGKLYGLENLQDNFEGFQEGVKSVMLWQRQQQEVHADGQVSAANAPSYRPVSEVVEVPPQYELAMEVGLGQRLQMLLSESQESSLQAVDFLKEKKSGRSSFVSSDIMPLESSEERGQALAAEPGVEGLLFDKVSVPSEYQGQVAHFLKDIVIVDSIRTALNLRPNYAGYQFVTLDGDMLSSDGVLTGGAADSANSGLMQRKREIKELSLRREELAGKLALAEVSLKKMAEQVEMLEKSLQEARTRNSEKEIQVVGLKKDLERAETEFENAELACTKQEKEVDSVGEQVQRWTNDIAEAETKLSEVKSEIATLQEQVALLDAEYQQHREGIDDLQDEVMQLKVASATQAQEASGLQNQLDQVDRSLAEVESQLGEMSKEKEKSQESLSTNSSLIEESRVELERYIREAEESKSLLSQSKDLFEQVSAKCRELEESVHAIQTQINDEKARMNESQLKLEQLKMREQYLIEQMRERYQVELTEVASRYQDDERDFSETKKEVADLKNKISRIGEVNLSAIEEYDDLVERYEFMSKQFEELKDAKEQLQKVIDRINRICSKRFKETFEQVNERFIKVFPVLFGGGEARLILVENPEKDEVGIDIVSRPPGKKLQNVSLLSGGEKALTAVSLIFSIFLVKPSPFCLLDEVDAPLDDANVFRFNDLVREMAKRSQIIVVTHNKYTMKVNNKIFGVTMEEKGVSKMVSVSIDQAEKVVEA